MRGRALVQLVLQTTRGKGDHEGEQGETRQDEWHQGARAPEHLWESQRDASAPLVTATCSAEGPAVHVRLACSG